jgi:hypothetical protein
MAFVLCFDFMVMAKLPQELQSLLQVLDRGAHQWLLLKDQLFVGDLIVRLRVCYCR